MTHHSQSFFHLIRQYIANLVKIHTFPKMVSSHEISQLHVLFPTFYMQTFYTWLYMKKVEHCPFFVSFNILNSLTDCYYTLQSQIILDAFQHVHISLLAISTKWKLRFTSVGMHRHQLRRNKFHLINQINLKRKIFPTISSRNARQYLSLCISNIWAT